MKMKNKLVPVAEQYVKEIITDYNELSKICNEVDVNKINKDIQKIVLELKNTIRANPDICALSANQIGYNYRIFCVNFNGDIRTFVNPFIERVGEVELSREKCHSIPDKEFIRVRHNKIVLSYQTPLGKVETNVTFLGQVAKVIQHHIDHLNGLLLSDIALEIDEEFDKASKEEQAEVINYYLDSIDLQLDEINKSIESDEDAVKMRDAVNFIKSVNSGETEIESVELDVDEIDHIRKIEQEFKNSVNND